MSASRAFAWRCALYSAGVNHLVRPRTLRKESVPDLLVSTFMARGRTVEVLSARVVLQRADKQPVCAEKHDT